MKRLHISRDIAAPPEVVWDLLVDVGRWAAWGPSVRDVRLDTPRIALGSRGMVETVAGVRLPFEITELEEGRAWSWKVGGVSATDHTVEPLERGRTRVTFGVPWLATPYLGICALALRRIDRLAVEENR